MLKEEYQRKDGKTWKTTFVTEDPETVYKDLAANMAGKYVEKRSYITKIVRKQHYTHKTYTVYHDNGGRIVFTVDAHF